MGVKQRVVSPPGEINERSDTLVYSGYGDWIAADLPHAMVAAGAGCVAPLVNHRSCLGGGPDECS